jgi:hypothetical protein
MTFAGMNYLAIVVAAAIGFVFGGIYYRTLSAQWLAASGVRKENVQGHPWGLYATAVLANLAMAWVLAGILGHFGAGQVTIRNGLISGFFVWFGFVATTIAVNNGFAMRKPMLGVIDAGHWLGVLLIMGAILGVFGV